MKEHAAAGLQLYLGYTPFDYSILMGLNLRYRSWGTDNSINRIFNSLQWSSPLSHGLNGLHASMSIDEIHSLLSQAGWSMNIGPMLIVDGHLFKISGAWSWHHGRHILGFNCDYWDEGLGCWALLAVDWGPLKNVSKSFHLSHVHC